MEFPLKRHLKKARVIMSFPEAENTLVECIQLVMPLSAKTATPVAQCLLLWLMTSIKISAASFHTYSILSAQPVGIFSSFRTSTILLLSVSTARLQRMDFRLNSSLKPQYKGREHPLKWFNHPVIRIGKFFKICSAFRNIDLKNVNSSFTALSV